jgi:predicted dehydrogenase
MPAFPASPPPLVPAGPAVRFGIAGAGVIAGRFAREVRAAGVAEIAAVASRDGARARDFAARHAIPRAHHGYAGLLADGQVDIVYIAVTNNAHLDLIRQCAAAGRHILCEKPLGMNASQAAGAIRAAEQAGVFLMEGFMYRCHPQFAAVLGLVRDGSVGRLRHVEATYLTARPFDPEDRRFDRAVGGSAIMDIGCYPMSAARAIAGCASGSPFEDPCTVTGGGTLCPTGADIWATASLGFPSGVTGFVATGMGCPRASWSLRVHGEAGCLVVETPWSLGPDDPGLIVVTTPGGASRQVTVPPASAFAREAAEAASRIGGRPWPRPDGRPVSQESPLMSWRDSAGNAAALDAWRACTGTVFDADTDV